MQGWVRVSGHEPPRRSYPGGHSTCGRWSSLDLARGFWLVALEAREYHPAAMRARGLCPRILGSLACGWGLCAGCGDAPLCQSEVFVAFEQTAITSDLDAAAAGVQTEVHVRTSLREGDVVELEVLAPAGAVLESMSEPVAADGSVVFSGVSVPSPRVGLRAIGRGLCGEGRDEITVDVLAGADCTVQLDPEPEHNDYFAPLGVLSTRSDPDPVTPGYQTTVRVLTRPGWTTEIFRTLTDEQSLMVAVADASGVTALPVTVLDGRVGFRATCRGAGTQLASLTTTVIADTTPPSCELVAPAPGATITPALDMNHDLADGIQLQTVGHADGSDVAGESATLAIGPEGSAATEVPASDTDDAGMTSASPTLAPPSTPAAYDFALTMRDHAGNTCASLASYWVVYQAGPPAAVADFTAVAVDRQRIRLLWTAPGSAAQPVTSYIVKSSSVPLTEASFDSAGPAMAIGAPRSAGSAETFDVFPARTGAPRYFAIATRDASGKRSPVATAGPIVPVFDRTGAILPRNAAQGMLGFGSAIAHGKLDDDEFDDVAVAAPFQSAGTKGGVGAVYVYFGGPSGIAATPGLTILGAETGANLGAGLTAVRWSSATRDDLVIGAPGADGGAGRIFVFRGGAGFGTGTRSASTADLTISVSATQPGWFANSGLGSVLVTADVDGDRTVDLVASAPRGGNKGGAVILYGGTVAGNVVLSDQNAGAANGAIVERFADPGAAVGRRLGFYLHAVGPTRGPSGASVTTDDLVIAYADNYATPGDSLYVLRGTGVRPATAGVTERPFAPGRDVRLDYATSSRVTEWGSQVASIEDQNGDGARDLVIGAYRAQNDRGQVLIVSGNIVGTGGVARTSDTGVTLATINPAAAVSRFGAAIASHAALRADIDGDGREDLFVAGRSGVSGTGFVWFGGAIPRGTVTTATAPYAIAAPVQLTFQRQRPQGLAGQAQWIGDINHDGLDDLCWASPFDNNGDGALEVLWDAR